jgi:hypothetical protein
MKMAWFGFAVGYNRPGSSMVFSASSRSFVFSQPDMHLKGAFFGRMVRCGVFAVVACLATMPVRAEKFTIAVIPDTQDYTTLDANMAGFTTQMQYIASIKVSSNVVFASHLGDMVNDRSSQPAEWTRAQGAMNILRDSEIPFGIAIGNHDYDTATVPISGTTNWVQCFGPTSSYFQGKSWYHSHASNVTDSYQVFHAAGRNFLHIDLELEPSADSLQWASQIIQAHPGMPTIVSTHEYLTYAGNRSSNSYRGGSTGTDVWTNFVSPNSQIFMVLCGHSFGSNGEGAINHASTNAAGKLVYEELTDYQGVGVTGSGWMRFMQFDSDLQQISFTTYSPLLNASKTDPTNQFQVQFDWNARFGTLPAITDVHATSVTQMKATIQWTTDSLSDSYVLYGTSPSAVTNLASVAGNVTTHSVKLTALVPGATYYYEVVSAASIDDNQGALYTFTTTTPCPCH